MTSKIFNGEMWNMQDVSNSISNMAFEKQERKRDTKEAHKIRAHKDTDVEKQMVSYSNMSSIF